MDIEARIRADHPLRTIKTIVDEALAALSAEFKALGDVVGAVYNDNDSSGVRADGHPISSGSEDLDDILGIDQGKGQREQDYPGTLEELN